MNWSTFIRTLVDLAPGRRPTRAQLQAAVLAAVENEEEHERLREEGPCQVLLDRADEAPSSPLVTLVWGDGFGSAVSVELIEAGDYGLLVQRDDSFPDEDRTLACLVSPRRPGAIVEQLAKVRHSVINVGPPSQITNHAPDLIPATVIRGLYSVCWENELDPAVHLLDRLDGPAAYARLRQHLPRTRSVHESIARLEMLRDQEDPELTDEDGRLLRDLHFVLIYSEVPR